MSVARRVIVIALRAYPAAFRDRLGDSLLETFELAYEDRSDGLLGRALFVAGTTARLVVDGLRERLRPSFVARRESPRFRSTLSSRLSWAAKELSFATRSFLKRPAFSMMIVATLAIGFGGNAAIFSIVNAVLLEPLPYEDPAGIITVVADWRGPDPGLGSMSYPDIVDLEEGSEAITSLVGVNRTSLTLMGQGEARVIEVGRVTKGLLDSFRIAPALGRDLRADEFGDGGPTVVVLSYPFWQSHFAGSTSALGKTLELGGYDYEIVGVAPEGFDYPDGAVVWIPRRLDPEDCGRGCHTMVGVGRLHRGDALDRARLEAAQVAENLEAAYPDENANKGFLVRSLRDQTVADVRSGLFLLLGAVGLVLLIACANVASLLLARASSRGGEMAIRTALGAGRGHLIGQTLLESFVLSAVGGVIGLALAQLVLLGLPRLTESLPRMDQITIDPRVLAFTAATVLVTTFVFGLAPALAMTRTSLRSGLGHAATASAGQTVGRHRFRRSILVGEVALSTLLLVGAGLLLKSFTALYAVDVGFETRGVSRFNVLLPESRYESVDAVRLFYRDLEARLETLPGVDAVASVWGPPLGRGRATGNVIVSGRPEPPPELEREASIHSVGPGWFETMRVALVRGRGLTAEDDRSDVPVAVVNETFVRQHFPDEDPIGREVEVTVDLGYGSPPFRIVGVSTDIRSRGLAVDPEAQIYVPHGVFGPENMTVSMRTLPDAPSPFPAARAILAEMEPMAPMYRVETMREALDKHVAPTRFYLILTGAFAVLAALLAAVGLYGVVSESAAARTREIGLRLALGARGSAVLRLVLTQGMVPAIVGLAVGLIAAFLGARVMDAVAYAVDPRDPWIYVSSAGLLLVVALVATLIPAARVSRVDPVRALKLD